METPNVVNARGDGNRPAARQDTVDGLVMFEAVPAAWRAGDPGPAAGEPDRHDAGRPAVPWIEPAGSRQHLPHDFMLNAAKAATGGWRRRIWHAGGGRGNPGRRGWPGGRRGPAGYRRLGGHCRLGGPG